MTSSKKPNVFIIVLNWNGAEDTIECLYSLQKLHYSNYKIIVVDNASTDESVPMIKNEFQHISILQLNENKGYAGGNNEGIRFALEHAADYIWILNNDTIVDEFALKPLVKKMQTNASVGICGSMLIYHSRRDRVQAMGGGSYNKWLGITHTIGDMSPAGQPFEMKTVEEMLDFVVGASLMVSRKFVESVGLMNEEYFLFYEEMDWATRGRQKGFSLGFAPDSRVYHKHGLSVNIGMKSGEKRSKMADYYQIKNRMKFSRNFFPYCLPSVYLTVIAAFFKRLASAQWERAVMILKLMYRYNK